MVSKITISLPDDLVERIDREAAKVGDSRSGVIREASARYLDLTAEERRVEGRRRRVLAALDDMKAMAAEQPRCDSRPTLEVLREIRETNDSAPLRDTSRGRGGTVSGYSDSTTSDKKAR